jgi:hypothetical protein
MSLFHYFWRKTRKITLKTKKVLKNQYYLTIIENEKKHEKTMSKINKNITIILKKSEYISVVTSAKTEKIKNMLFLKQENPF